jgi:hypothetical protein
MFRTACILVLLCVLLSPVIRGQSAGTPSIEAMLKVGPVTGQVLVQANAAMVETHSTGVVTVIDQQRVVDLPY